MTPGSGCTSRRSRAGAATPVCQPAAPEVGLVDARPSSRDGLNINSQIVVNNKLRVDVLSAPVRLFATVATRRDDLTEQLRLEIKRLMLHHGDMQQIELARRAKEAQQRVHKFVKGQMPYPPLDFLDRLFRVFGVTLVDGLRGAVKPVTQLPILREDVQLLADTCAPLEPEGVAAVQHLASTLRDGVRRGASRAPGASARPNHTPRTNDKRRTRKD